MEHDTFEMASRAAKHLDDKEIQKRIAGGEAKEALADMGILVPMNMEVSVVANTNDVFHVVMPADPNVDLSDDELLTTSGGGPNVWTRTGTQGTAHINYHSTAASHPSCVANPPSGGS